MEEWCAMMGAAIRGMYHHGGRWMHEVDTVTTEEYICEDVEITVTTVGKCMKI